MKTDLNERERARFRAELRKLAESANECADALELEDDDRFIVTWLMFGVLGGHLMAELKPIIIAAARGAGMDTSKF